MIFSSWSFLLYFLPVAIALFKFSQRSGHLGMVQSSLLLASCVFYASWSVPYLLLLLTSITVNWYFGGKLQSNKKRSLLFAAVLVNLTPLLFYKYSGWLTGYSTLTNLILPLGISFYTFQQIGYLVDCYRGKTIRDSYLGYACFVSFFPQLIAGPIVSHKKMHAIYSNLHQHYFDWSQTALGIHLFVAGLIKKVVIADNIAPVANKLFSYPDTASFADAWLGTFAYTFQLYFDFSGYCEMAMGAALLFGVALPINFNSPYKARSITEFWRRWHITLGAFFKDYIYIPLGGNRHGLVRTLALLALIAFISGVWHGAGSTFVLWGVMHGVALVAHRLWSGFDVQMPTAIATLLCFIFVSLSWVMFRAETVHDALTLYGLMLLPDIATLSNHNLLASSYWWAVMGLSVVVFFFPNIHETGVPVERQKILQTATALFITLITLGHSNEFLYFQF